MDQENRVVVLIDMDCFYCQVEEKLNPHLKGKPIAVVQYNPWKGGGIIAVNYVARAMGVTRNMRGDEAKEKCPEIQLSSVPCQRGKADISKYREAGKEVARVLQTFTPLMERASIDEAYLDITTPVQERLRSLNIETVGREMTPNSFALGYKSMDEFVSDIHNYSEDIDFDYEHAKRLLVGALIVSEIRDAVYNETGYRCSAGIAHNKILAKLVCGMNKPNKQTVLPKHCVNTLYKTLSVKKVKHLGGKFGDMVCEVLRIKHMAELQQFAKKELQAKFDEKNGLWLYNIARGIDLEPVQARFNPKSIGCCKQFKGKSALLDLNSLKRWLKDLGDEIEDRLEKDGLENNRMPRQMVVSYSVQIADRDTSSSRSYNFGADDDLCGQLFSNKALELVLDGMEGSKPNKDGEENRRLKLPIKFLGISVGKFEDHSEIKKTKKIKDYFAAGSSNEIALDVKESRMEEFKSERRPNNNNGKKHIMQKKMQASSFKNSKDDKKTVLNNSNSEPVIESSLDKQESFFAKFLKTEKTKAVVVPLPTDCQKQGTIISYSSEVPDVINEEVKDRSGGGVENSGEDSNDTYCSGSTIDEEINKSIALFEEDTEDINRVSKMRQLLKSTMREKENDAIPDLVKVEPLKSVSNEENTIVCSDCGKTVPIDSLDIHSDYHLALKLRDEERQQARKEMKKRSISKEVADKETKKKKQILEEVCNKVQPISSIANFITKLDSTVPSKTCSECGKRVANDKFLEHSDFHEAQKLSREINNKTISVASGNAKRKRKSVSPTKKPKVPCKSIDLFFR